MALKYFFVKHIYAISAITIIIMIVVFSMQISYMKSQFHDRLKDTETKFTSDLIDAMTKRERQINRLQAGISQDNLRRWDIIAVEKIIGNVNKNLSDEVKHQYATYIVDEVNRYDNIDLTIWLSLLAQESRFRVAAESDKDAVGLGQIIPETARWICKEIGVPYNKNIRLNPKMNLKMSAWYFSFLMGQYNNDVELALAHYNGGTWQKNSWKYTRIFKNSPEYKSMTVNELRAKVSLMKKEIPLKERNEEKTKRAIEYQKYRKIYRAKRLVPETAAYVPEILSRAKKFNKFYNGPNSIVPEQMTKVKEK